MKLWHNICASKRETALTRGFDIERYKVVLLVVRRERESEERKWGPRR